MLTLAKRSKRKEEHAKDKRCMLIEIWAYRGLGGESESMTQKIFGSRSIVKYEQFKYKQIVIKKKRIKIKINNISYQIQKLLIKNY